MFRSVVGPTLLVIVCAVVVGCGGFTAPTTTTSSTTSSTTTTTTEPPAAWSRLEPSGETPSPRCYQSMVYDAGLRKVIMFAGFDGTLSLDETWLYDPSGNTWKKREVDPEEEQPPPAGPSAGGRIAAVYEPLTGRVVAFDGNTWAYDPGADTWKDLRPKGDRPSPRLGSCMAYDWSNGKAVLFGGTDMVTWFNDTWVYDSVANKWTQMEATGDVPPGRSDYSMVYEEESKRMILFGGVANFSCFNDTWAYDPSENTWVELTPAGEAPRARCGHVMVYDPDQAQVVLFGGIDADFVRYNDTWAYDPVTNIWTDLLPPGESPLPRGRAAAVYVATIDKLVLFGGSGLQEDPAGGYGTEVYYNDFWTFGKEK